MSVLLLQETLTGDNKQQLTALSSQMRYTVRSINIDVISLKWFLERQSLCSTSSPPLPSRLLPLTHSDDYLFCLAHKGGLCQLE